MAVGVGGAVWGAKVGGEGGKLPRVVLLPDATGDAAPWRALRAFCSSESFNSRSSASLEERGMGFRQLHMKVHSAFLRGMGSEVLCLKV